MPTILTLVFSILCYIAATCLIAGQIRGNVQSNQQNINLNNAYIAATFAAVLHVLYALYTGSLVLPVNVSLSAMATSVSAIIVIIFLLGCAFLSIRRLGILVFPLAAISLLFSSWWASEANIVANSSLAFNIHIMVSVLSYSLLTIATIQALLFFFQERQIKNPGSKVLMAMPPLQTMEQLLFQLLGIGFLLLTVTLLSGAMFSQQIFGQAFEFKHHTILALLGWAVFAVLLFKRLTAGLRGTQAVAWTIAGFVFIQLGYFGTKIVSESLNIQ